MLQLSIVDPAWGCHIYAIWHYKHPQRCAGVAKPVDARGLKPLGITPMQVQPLPPAPTQDDLDRQAAIEKIRYLLNVQAEGK
jgi:hypothetical protein